MEYRIWFYDTADVEVDWVKVKEITTSGDYMTFQSEKLRRSIGNVIDDTSASEEKAVQATVSDGTGYMQYGPYTAFQTANNTYKAIFRLKTSDNTNGNVIARIDVNNSNGSGVWNYRDLKGTDFAENDTYQNFSLIFNRLNEGTIEFRIYTYGLVDLTSDYARVEVATESANTYESEDLSSAVGSVAADTDASNELARQALPTDIGYLQYGPHTIEQASGNSYKAVFRLSTTNNSSNAPVARIEAYNFNGNGKWRYRIIKANDFARTYNYEDFSIDFTRTTQGSMEYRVYVYGNSIGATINSDNVQVYKKNDSEWVYESEDGYSNIGRVILDSTASNSKAREATFSTDRSGYVVYGPYSDDQPAGNVYTATFRLKSRSNNRNDDVARIEVYNPSDPSSYVAKNIKGIDFSSTNIWQDFSINFARQQGGTLEFRVYSYGIADILSDKVTVANFSSDLITYQAENQLRSVGAVISDATADGGSSVLADSGNGQGYMSYGPYTVDQPRGNYQVQFRLKKEVSVSTYTPLVRIEIVNQNGNGTYVWKDLTSRDLKSDYNDFSLYFYRTGEGSMEYRVYFYDALDVTLDKITVSKI
jgi:hypothetical protein